MNKVHLVFHAIFPIALLAMIGVMIWAAFDLHNRLPIYAIIWGCFILFIYLPWKATK